MGEGEGDGVGEGEGLALGFAAGVRAGRLEGLAEAIGSTFVWPGPELSASVVLLEMLSGVAEVTSLFTHEVS